MASSPVPKRKPEEDNDPQQPGAALVVLSQPPPVDKKKKKIGNPSAVERKIVEMYNTIRACSHDVREFIKNGLAAVKERDLRHHLDLIAPDTLKDCQAMEKDANFLFTFLRTTGNDAASGVRIDMSSMTGSVRLVRAFLEEIVIYVSLHEVPLGCYVFTGKAASVAATCHSIESALNSILKQLDIQTSVALVVKGVGGDANDGSSSNDSDYASVGSNSEESTESDDFETSVPAIDGGGSTSSSSSEN